MGKKADLVFLEKDLFKVLARLDPLYQGDTDHDGWTRHAWRGCVEDAMNCAKCNQPFRNDSDDLFRLRDGTLVHTWCRTTQEFFEAVFDYPLEDILSEQTRQDRESAETYPPDGN